MAEKTAKIEADEALKLLEEAWAYYQPEPEPEPEPAPVTDDRQPDLFQYANAA